MRLLSAFKNVYNKQMNKETTHKLHEQPLYLQNNLSNNLSTPQKASESLLNGIDKRFSQSRVIKQRARKN